MKRIALTDDTGRWFNEESATMWEEGTRWDGNNHVSKHTSGQFYHQRLFRTASGIWVLNSYSQYEKDPETYEEITTAEAAGWLAIAEIDPPKEAEKEFAALEL